MKVATVQLMLSGRRGGGGVPLEFMLSFVAPDRKWCSLVDEVFSLPHTGASVWQTGSPGDSSSRRGERQNVRETAGTTQGH